MDVLVFTPTYPTPEHPRGIFVRAQARAAREAGADVAVCHLDGVAPLYRRPWSVERTGEAELPVYRVRFRLPAPWRSLWLMPLLLGGAEAALRAARADGRAPDVLHAHFDTAALPAALLGRLHGIPVVHTEHSTVFRDELSPVRALRGRAAVRLASLTCPVSGELEERLRRLEPRGEYQVMPNSFDSQVFHDGAARNGHGRTARLLCVALLTENKGIPDLLRAVARLPAERATLDLVGDGPERERYETLARELGLGERVRFHGIKQSHEVARFMRESDLFVLASHTENNPCVLLEAMASGLPIVATAVGGVPEIVDETVGALVPPHAPDELAAALEGAIDELDRFDRAAIARNADATYSHRVMGERWLATYERLLAD